MGPNVHWLHTAGDSIAGKKATLLKLWQNKKGSDLFEMLAKNDVFLSAASCKKDIIFGGHLKQISALLISLEL